MWNMRFDPPGMTQQQRQQQQARAGRGRGRGSGPGGPVAGPGTYLVTMTANGIEYINEITIRQDPIMSKK